MIVAIGRNVAMAKMIPMHATQACYNHQAIGWSSIGSKWCPRLSKHLVEAGVLVLHPGATTTTTLLSVMCA